MNRVLASHYMHWAKTQTPARFNLASSEVPHFRLDRFPIEIAALELDGASRYRYPELRERIARKNGVAAERVVMADGTSMANMLAMAALIAPGDEVLIEHPAYEPMVATALHLGADLRRFTRHGPAFAIDPASVEAALSERTRLIVLTNLHNPTGNLADEATMRALGVMAARVGARVLIDEVYLDAAIPAEAGAAHLGDVFVTTSSLTKVHGLSGLRCGWILAEPELAERMWRLNELFGVAQAHADERLSCIALDRLDEIDDGIPALLATNRDLANGFFAGCDDLEVAPMVNGITAFPRLRRGKVDDLHALLREQYDTAIVPGRFFGLADHFRIGVGGPTEMIEAALERLGAGLDALA
jgi:aspartate/methionine/tyrosine aminotransferase